MNNKNVILITCFSLSLFGCGGGGGGSTSSNSVSTSAAVTLSSSASSIYESATGTITITATLSRTVSENVTVTIGTSGTSTEGTDYSNVSNITISAGNTTGTATFNPTSDSVYENSNETAILSITGVSGGGASESGNQSVTITINEYALNSGTQLTYSSSNATTLAATTEFQYINATGADSVQNPLEVINAHKAYGYGLTGQSKLIAILDSGFDTNVLQKTNQDINSTATTTFGTLTIATGASSLKDHGLIVSTIAAGEDDGLGMQGVAPDANLHIASYDQINSNSYYPTHWANATDNAAYHDAVVQNNSWGATNSTIATVNTYKTNNSLTNSAALAAYFTAGGLSSDEASVNTYVTSLNNFQDKGVVVFALSNTSSLADADAHAALPEFYSQLSEAWITAVNVEITGSSGNETYTRKSAPCGSTGLYCLGADGWQLKGGAYVNGNPNAWWNGVGGTSFVAPQISGAVALLAEAFPNHTPEQITDRLLASADNSFFDHDAVVTFGNGISHGYDNEFGHGILDIYAALNPITSSSDNRSLRVFTGNTLSDNSVFQLGNSRLLMSSSFGDSMKRGLVGVVGYTYDDLDGGFQYDLNSHVNLSNKNAPSVDLSGELIKLSNPINDLPTSVSNDGFRQVAGSLNINDNLDASITVGAGSFPVQNFYDLNDNSVNLLNYQTPYLQANEGGVGLNAIYKLANSKFLLGATIPVEQSNGQTLGSRKSLVSSLEVGESSSDSITMMAGISADKDSLLGSQGTSAFSLDGSRSITTFAALKAQKRLNDNFSITGIASLGNTDMSSPTNSFVDSASDVRSSSVALIADMKNITNDDSFSFSIYQPNRVEKGSIAIKTASLADTNRNISQAIKSINLDSSSRQVNLGVSYRKNLSENLNFSLKHLITNNLNHINTSSKLHSSYLGMDFKDLKLGFATNPNDSSLETQISYAISL
ncbi:S8 family serine peptidase [Candidatus Pseudothioglobus singularis]|nr:S8 family serine peptidase [Candidatus Pseudothioglobus singularis]